MTRPPRPRIAVLSPFIDKRHGTERCIAEQIERLAKSFEIHLYSSRVADLDLTDIVWHRIWIPPGPHLFGFLWWFFANSLHRGWRRLRGFRPDLIYSPGINCFDADLISVHVLFANVRHEFIRRYSSAVVVNNPSISFLQSVHLRIYYWLLSALEKKIYSDERVKLVAVSQKTAREVQDLFHRRKPVDVIYHGIESARFSPARRQALRADARTALRLHDDTFAILLIGNEWRNKGLLCLLDAVQRLHNPSIHLLVVGEDSAAPYKEIIQKLGLGAQVSFLPPRADVEFFYAAADVYAGPSLEDAFSLPPAEAMACGLPAITSRAAGVSEIIHHGENGLILEDSGDSEKLSGWLAKLGAQPELCKMIGEAAVKTIAQYSWKRNAEELKVVFDSVLELKSLK